MVLLVLAVIAVLIYMHNREWEVTELHVLIESTSHKGVKGRVFRVSRRSSKLYSRKEINAEYSRYYEQLLSEGWEPFGNSMELLFHNNGNKTSDVLTTHFKRKVRKFRYF